MSVELKEPDNGKLLEVYLTGKLVKTDYETFLPAVERLVKQHGKLLMLVEFNDCFMAGQEAHCGRTSSSTRNTSMTSNGWRSLARINGKKEWRHSASRSPRRKSATSITPMLPRRGTGLFNSKAALIVA